MSQRIVVVGAGVFGITAATELTGRGHDVTVVDPGPLPHPEAASTDITKMVRADYGPDVLYTAMMEEALPLWRDWNTEWGRRLYHEDGYLVLSGGPYRDGDYEYESVTLLEERGHQLRRLTPSEVALRHPQWRVNEDAPVYLNPEGGYAESGQVMARLITTAVAMGVTVVEQPVTRLSGDGTTVTGVETPAGAITADLTIVAAGAWTPQLVPELSDRMWSVGQPVIHFRPAQPDRFRPPRFPPWAHDIGRTGWYGFPALADGTVKVANHGPGRRLSPSEPRVVSPEWEPLFREFFRARLPGLADAPAVADRLCLYCDTFDGDFWIDLSPDHGGLAVAAGGNGHGFKFAPILGRITADVVEGRYNPFAERFRWRSLGPRSSEAARNSGIA